MTFNDVYPITAGPLRPSDPIFSKLNFLKLEDIFKFQVSKFVFKCLYGNIPLQFPNWFTLNYEKYGHRTRSNYNTNNGIFIKSLFVPSARTTNYGLKQLRVTGPRKFIIMLLIITIIIIIFTIIVIIFINILTLLKNGLNSKYLNESCAQKIPVLFRVFPYC